MKNKKPYVGRAGLKLEFALKVFGANVKDKVCADFGSSTGGFVDCLLQHDAKKVYSVDTSYGELDWQLRNNKRVVVMERTNAIHVLLPEKVDLITIDTGWTKQEKIIPSAIKNLKDNGKIITLIKPHYEASNKQLKKGRVDEKTAKKIAKRVSTKLESLGLKVLGFEQSPILGSRGKKH